MAVHDMLMAAAGATSTQANWIDDCFSSYLYTGNYSTNTITNGIDLSTKGGLVWFKNRTSTAQNWALYDTARCATNRISSNTTNAQATLSNGLTSFNTDGFSVGNSTEINDTAPIASWTFRKQAKFFDVVTYTGNGSTQNIAHNLGSTPGCIMIKRTDTTANWSVYHAYNNVSGYDPSVNYLVLNTTAATTTNNSVIWNSTRPTSSVFSVGNNATVNASGGTYVAYIFADYAGGFGTTGTDQVIKCGRFTTNGSGIATIDFGFEPQWLLMKSSSANDTYGWFLIDNMRGWTTGGDDAQLYANSSTIEALGNVSDITSTGFSVRALASSTSYIYIAIRRPMKPPTTGTEVFASTLWTGPSSNTNIDMGSQTNGFGTGSLSILKQRNGTQTNGWFDTLRGSTQFLWSSAPNAESTDPGGISVVNNKLRLNSSSYFGAGGDGAGVNYVAHHFKRAPGFFDEVCYTGNGSANRVINHNLVVAPELIIKKDRNDGFDWNVQVPGTLGYSSNLTLNSSNANTPNGTTYLFSSGNATSLTTATNFDYINALNTNYVVYLFATVAGVSKVGSYTGNGSSQTINCGFSGGARFVMIKRTSSTNNWYVWDTARGIVSGNDPYIALNNNFAEQTAYDSIDPDSSGFIVNEDGTGNNTSGATYIYLAIA